MADLKRSAKKMTDSETKSAAADVPAFWGPVSLATPIAAVVVGFLFVAGASKAVGGDTVATAVYSKVSNNYKRQTTKDGRFKPEYYALSNGGRIYGTTSDQTVDRVTYPQVAEIAMRLLTQQNYHYAQNKEQAKLLLVLQWGSTLAPDDTHKQANVAANQVASDNIKSRMADLEDVLASGGASKGQAQGEAKNTLAGFGPSMMSSGYRNEHAALMAAADSMENQMLRTLVDNRVRDELNYRNARVIGYADDLADASDIRRWAGGGERFKDLIIDVEESRYYIVVSAYDFQELLKTKKQKLLWQTRVSVRSPGNSFDDAYLAMLKSAAPYFGQNSGKLVRREESKGTVELGDLKFIGEVKDTQP